MGSRKGGLGVAGGFWFFLCAGVVVLAAMSAPADVYRVKADSTAESPDGATWETAYRNIQPAVDAASAAGGGEVWVAAGTYTGTSSPILTIKENVSVYGGFEGVETIRDARNWTANMTIIDGSNMYQVVAGAKNSILDGFTVQNGKFVIGAGMSTAFDEEEIHKATATNCNFINNNGEVGGGMYGCTAINCTFINNTAWAGGGMCDCIATNCIFTGPEFKV